MKLQRSTVMLVAIALLLGGVVLVTQSQQSDPDGPTATPGESDTSPVFEFEEEAVMALQVETADQVVSFERDEAGFWQMVEPEAHPAEEAAIAFLLSRLTSDGLVQTTPIEAANQAEYGLDDPFATVELTLEDGTEHLLVLGDADFSGQNYYALVNPEPFPLPEDAGEVAAAIVTENIFNGVDRPLEEWKAVVEDDASESDGTSEPGASETEAEDEGAEESDGSGTDAADEPTVEAEEEPADDDDAEADSAESEDTESESTETP